MSRYLIEVDHEPKALACDIAAKVFAETGAHLLTHADWGCTDGVHKGWIVVDVNSREEARAVLPAAFRQQARVIKLNKFSLEKLDYLVELHQPKAQLVA